MKHLRKEVHLFFLIMFSLLLTTSCDYDTVTTDENQTLLSRFTRSLDEKTITFINISENATSYLWDFGDGTTSTSINPIKTYLNGSYTVVLTAKNTKGESSTFSDSFIIDGCLDEVAENLDPANGSLNWTFFNANGNASFDAFGNIGGGIVNNPTLDAVNSSCKVFAFTKANGCETWSGVGYVLNSPLNFGTIQNKIFKIKVLAETQVTEVTLLLEKNPFPNNNPFIQRVATITEVGKWQELSFDFSDVSSGTFKNMVIYFERNTVCDGDVYYFDDITQE